MEKLSPELLFSKLASLGDFYELDIEFSESQFWDELSGCDKGWRVYNSSKPEYKREGLSLFSLDGSSSGEIDLNSVREYNKANQTQYNEMSFNTPTEYWKQLNSLSEPLKEFESHMGRSHLIRLGEGGFFPPHRDLGETFRLIAFFGASPNSLYLMVEDKKVFFKTGSLYFLNTKKEHTLFSFQTSATFLVLNLALNAEAMNLVRKNLVAK